MPPQNYLAELLQQAIGYGMYGSSRAGELAQSLRQARLGVGGQETFGMIPEGLPFSGRNRPLGGSPAEQPSVAAEQPSVAAEQAGFDPRYYSGPERTYRQAAGSMISDALSSAQPAQIQEGRALIEALARRRDAEQRAMAGFPSMNPNPPEMAGLRPMGRFEAADNPQLQMARENTPEARRARELVQLEQRRAEMRAGKNRSGTQYTPGKEVGKSIVGRMGDGQIALQGTLTPEEMAAALKGRDNLRAAAKAFRDERKRRIAERRAAPTTDDSASLIGVVQTLVKQGLSIPDAMALAQAQAAVPAQKAAFALDERQVAALEKRATTEDLARAAAERQRQQESRDALEVQKSGLQLALEQARRDINRDTREMTAAEADAAAKQRLIEFEMASRVVPLIQQPIPGTNMTLAQALGPGTTSEVRTPDGGVDKVKLNALFQNNKLTDEQVGRLKQFGLIPERSWLQRALGRMPGDQFGAYDAAEYGSMVVPGLWPLKASLEYSRPVRDAMGIPILN